MTGQGHSTSNHGGQTEIMDRFRYPFNMTLFASAGPSSTRIVGHINHTYSRNQSFPFSSTLGPIEIDTTQNSAGQLVLDLNGRAISGIGRTMQDFSYKNGLGGTYFRNVDIYNSTHTVTDKQSGTLLPDTNPQVLSGSSSAESSLGRSLLSTDDLPTQAPPSNVVSLSAIADRNTQLHGDDKLVGTPCRTLPAHRAHWKPPTHKVYPPNINAVYRNPPGDSFRCNPRIHPGNRHPRMIHLGITTGNSALYTRVPEYLGMRQIQPPDPFGWFGRENPQVKTLETGFFLEHESFAFIHVFLTRYNKTFFFLFLSIDNAMKWTWELKLQETSWQLELLLDTKQFLNAAWVKWWLIPGNDPRAL